MTAYSGLADAADTLDGGGVSGLVERQRHSPVPVILEGELAEGSLRPHHRLVLCFSSYVSSSTTVVLAVAVAAQIDARRHEQRHRTRISPTLRRRRRPLIPPDDSRVPRGHCPLLYFALVSTRVILSETTSTTYIYYKALYLSRCTPNHSHDVALLHSAAALSPSTACVYLRYAISEIVRSDIYVRSRRARDTVTVAAAVYIQGLARGSLTHSHAHCRSNVHLFGAIGALLYGCVYTTGAWVVVCRTVGADCTVHVTVSGAYIRISQNFYGLRNSGTRCSVSVGRGNERLQETSPYSVSKMVLESTMICVDNSDYMRNGDFLPTRLQAQQDAVNLVCHSKTRTNPENNVGLITLANVEVLATLTSDVGRILSKLHQVQPNGNLCLITGIRIAHLALKHRQGKNHKMRIVAFVGSPILIDEKEAVKLAKRLKKEKVNVDIISFGEESINNEVLTAFVNALNGKDGTGSHLVTIPPGPHLSDALMSSPIIQGEDGMGGAGMGGAAFEFGVDPNEDPELALALRVSMEEQRQRQEEEARRNQTTEAAPATKEPEASKEVQNEEALLKQALAMSLEGSEESSAATESTAPSSGSVPNFAHMTEEEQIAFAMQMSMQDQQELEKVPAKEEPMEVEEDYATVMSDTEFLQSVLENLPGVDPQSEAVRQAVGSLQQNKDKEKEKEKDKDKDKDKDQKK